MDLIFWRLKQPKFNPLQKTDKQIRGKVPLLKGRATLKASASQMQVFIKSCNMPQTLLKSNEK